MKKSLGIFRLLLLCLVLAANSSVHSRDFYRQKLVSFEEIRTDLVAVQSFVVLAGKGLFWKHGGAEQLEWLGSNWWALH